VSAHHEDQISFDIAVTWSSDRVVVAVSGEVDMLTAPALAGALHPFADGGPREVVLDAANLSFMDAAGLGVIAATGARLRGSGLTFAVRSPLPMVLRLLDLTHLGGYVETDTAQEETAGLGSEQRTGDRSGATRSASAVRPGPGGMPTEHMRASSDVVVAALRLVTALARKTVAGADGVSVSLTRQGRLSTVAASDETIAQMDRDQYATGQGPCVSAAAEGRWFHVESLAEESRWPQFIPRAREGGIGSILSTPLLVATRPVGALNIYSNSERAFGREGQELAALFATQASGILAEAGLDPSADATAAAMQAALQARAVIAQAQGVVMARQGVSADSAFATLRLAAAQAGVPVLHRASEIVASSQREGLIGEVRP